ncbi:hypothetical protein LTS17_001751 [Exophiala oligosperma]
MGHQSQPSLRELKTRQDALNFIYMYGYPLLEFGKFVASSPRASVNTLYHDRRLSTDADLKVIRPNGDTLYSTVLLDLSAQKLEFSIPSIPDRYWCWSFYDCYGNDLANVNSLQNHKPGKFLVRCSEDEEPGLSLDCSRGDIDGYAGCITMSSMYGICLVRIATTPSIADQSLANRYQDQSRVVVIERGVPPVAGPPFDLSLFTQPGYRPSKDISIVESVLRLTAALAPILPSPVRRDRPFISKALSMSGIQDGILTRDSSGEADLSILPRQAESEARAARREPGGKLDHGNGWVSWFPESMGNFGSDYAARFAIAKYGYLGLTPDQATYPSLEGSIYLAPGKALVIRFSRRPVLNPGGFWSLTAYNAQQYFIPNRLNRFCLGDRDNLWFVDGTPLADKGKDGPFEVLVQPANSPPPKEWTDNWLPAPAGGGKMSVTLRWYGAAPEMMTEAYEYPRLRYVEMIAKSQKAIL